MTTVENGKKLYSITCGGVTILWGRKLDPRESSGIKGEPTVENWYSVPEAAHLMKAINSNATSRPQMERDMLNHFGYVRKIEAVADKTPVPPAPQGQEWSIEQIMTAKKAYFDWAVSLQKAGNAPTIAQLKAEMQTAIPSIANRNAVLKLLAPDKYESEKWEAPVMPAVPQPPKAPSFSF